MKALVRFSSISAIVWLLMLEPHDRRANVGYTVKVIANQVHTTSGWISDWATRWIAETDQLDSSRTIE